MYKYTYVCNNEKRGYESEGEWKEIYRKVLREEK